MIEVEDIEIYVGQKINPNQWYSLGSIPIVDLPKEEFKILYPSK